MSTITAPRRPFAPIGVRRITVDEYERIIRAGALKDPDRVELLDGYLVDKMGKSAEHGYATKKAIKLLEARLHAGWTWRAEQPVRIPDFDEPEPDIAIVRGADEDYEHRLPGPKDVGLLIEVSLTTLERDRHEKGPAYARGGIPAYWIIDLVDRRIEVYTDPGPDGYRSCAAYGPGQAVPIAIDGQLWGELDVRSVLPSQEADRDGGDGA
jgi:Uma2 family endonuclease